MSGETGGHTIQQLTSNQSSTTATLPQYSVPAAQVSGTSKYTQLLSVIEELGKDIRPSYTNNKICSERLKRNIIRARILVRECLIETDRKKKSLKCIVATYQLHNHNTHSGSIYRLHGNKVDKLIALPGGVFRFAMQPDGYIISALTTGSVGVVNSNLDAAHILPVTKKEILLSIAICGNFALCSDVCGTVHVINLETGNISFSFLGHTSPYTDEPCEVWTTTWLDTNCILSGGEDNLLKLWDLRLGTKQPVTVNKTHQCGVISLHTENSEYVISGSYDDHLHRIDLRNFAQYILDKKINGSAWSIRIADENSYVVSCMYGGWIVMKKDNFDILQENNKLGEKLLYDADFSPQTSVIASCTFNNYSVNFETI
ncbi:WD domain protein, putative [Brugia malayi]|uniref:methylated diphthine methylhydrolase n=1 Tax=Brugia malayi TaxID=6279 RepID=A0A0K0JNK6_BRUMA|nr:WD domain protein, putative [Brugia malayi]CTP81538.1 Bm6542 [Brugia malayi]VIO92752.1 WD domain protein, putative [Brugia malayi]